MEAHTRPGRFADAIAAVLKSSMHIVVCLASTFHLIHPVYSSGMPLVHMSCIRHSRMTLGNANFMSRKRIAISSPLHQASFPATMT